jgi:uncharacterized protein with FMN-binding domain
VRKQARAATTVATMGVLLASYQFGTAAETGLVLDMPMAIAAPEAVPTEPAVSETAGAEVASTPSSSASSSAGETKAPVAATKAPAAKPTKAPVVAKTATGALIEYKYGSIQLEVTGASSKISDVTVLVGTGSDAKYKTLIQSLAEYAVAANGSDFGNVTGATFTTNAFKQALDSAIAKL